MMKNGLLILLLILSVNARAQKIPDMGLYKIRIVTPEKNITAEIKPVNSEPDLDPGRFYTWYSSNHISQTQGGFSGTLLNGHYSEFYLNKNLKEQGEFTKGLKTGIWKDWNEMGLLISEITWKNGVKNGVYQLFDDKGDIKQKGNYNNGLLSGKQYTYLPKGAVEITYYKKGMLTQPDTTSKFWRKLNIFKKNK